MKTKIKIGLLGQGEFFEIIKNGLSEKFIIDDEEPNLWIVANYGKKVSQNVLNQYPNRFLNAHPSLLPKLKGATPIQTAIMKNMKFTGFTIIVMDEKIDHGKMLAQEKIAIAKNDTCKTLTKKIARGATENLSIIIPLYLSGKIKAIQQNHHLETWTKKITDKDRIILPNELLKNPSQAYARTRALFPKPKAYLMLGDKRLIIHKAEMRQNKFCPLIVQLEGKKAIKWQEFLRGWKKKLPKMLTYTT